MSDRQPTEAGELSAWLCQHNGVNIDELSVEKMLKQAKVPPIAPEALLVLTRALIKAASRVAVVKRRCEFEKTQFEDEKKRRVAQIKPLRSEFKGAQAAIDELHCAVPKITSRLRRIASNHPNFPHYFERANAIDAWLASAPDFVKKPSSAPKAWVEPAKFILLHFQRATGITTLSREGPAVRFVKAALVACGVPDAGMISKAAIEKVITKNFS